MRIIIILILFFASAEAQNSALASSRQGLAFADSLYAVGNYTLAISTYARSNSLEADVQIGRAYNAIGNYDKAIIQYQAVVEKAPNLQIAQFELGKLRIKVGEFNEARKVFTKLTSLGKDNPEYNYYLGEAFRELQQPASSIVSYKNAIQKDSSHLRSLFQLAKYFVVKQETSQALLYIDKGLIFYENDISMINLKALALFNNNEYEKALPFFERLVALGERKEFIYNKLAYCYFKNWEFEKAKTTYNIVLDINDRNAETYYNLAQVYLKNRQLDSAKIYLKISIELKRPTLVREYAGLAGIARDQRNFKSALNYYKLAYAEDESNEWMYFNVCTAADQFYKDPKLKLQYYESYHKKFGVKNAYYTKLVAKRTKVLKEEIHFAKD